MNLMGNDDFPGNTSHNANNEAECSSGKICTNQCMILNGYCQAKYKNFMFISIYSKYTPRCLHKMKQQQKQIKQVSTEESVWESMGQSEWTPQATGPWRESSWRRKAMQGLYFWNAASISSWNFPKGFHLLPRPQYQKAVTEAKKQSFWFSF